MDQQVNILCKHKCAGKSYRYKKYIILDPKSSDITFNRIKSSNGLLLQKYPKSKGKLVKDNSD